MNRKQYKGRVEKCTLPKFTEVCRLYSPLHKAYATKLSKDPFIKEARCNVELEGLNTEHPYTSDFFCWKADESCMVREVTTRKSLSWPATINNLALSKEYWAKKGIEDWGIVIDG